LNTVGLADTNFTNDRQLWYNQKMDYRGGFTKINRSEPLRRPSPDGSGSGAGWLLFILGLSTLFAVIFFIYSESQKDDFPVAADPADRVSSTSTPGGLPADLGNGLAGDHDGHNLSDISAEDLFFGYFYEQPDYGQIEAPKQYELPLNTKIDVSNYYDFSRKIDVSPWLSELDQQGFIIIDDPFSTTDPFDLYRRLQNDGVPSIITSDFLLYYFQNTFKSAYSNIKKNAFYDLVWDISKELYNTSLTRYRTTVGNIGMSNDPVLEGQRLETVFFATALELLKPLPDQINNQPNLKDDTKFTEKEAARYDYLLPDNMKNDVMREVALIRQAEKAAKSPIFLYERDYRSFSVPQELKDAKLANFFLAMKWYNSQFPLYPRGEECPDCYLDVNDWTINFAAAHYISKDIFENPKIKNQWAVIYKFISFFSGLRSELTYLHYHRSFDDVFSGRTLESFFSRDNEKKVEELGRLRQAIMAYEFLPMEGGLDRASQRAMVGMRLLQDDYWPNKFIFDNLTGLDMKLDVDRNLVTTCRDKSKVYYRCKASAYDIANIFYPVRNNSYYDAITKYQQYDNRVSYLKDQIAEFDQNTWNNNVYWINFDLTRMFFEKGGFPFSASEEWKQLRGVNSFLGSWVNLHLPEDRFFPYSGGMGTKLGARECNRYNYIEPNKVIIKEMIARNQMLMDMLMELGVARLTNVNELKDMGETLERIDSIVAKEYGSEILSDTDCDFIYNLMTTIRAEKNAPKQIDLRKQGGQYADIRKQKILVLIYRGGDKLVLAAGPVFGFAESPN
jgi:hypothetical protein